MARFPNLRGDVAIAMGKGGNGEFSLALPAGSYALTVAADGFVDARREAAITEQAATEVVIELQLASWTDTVTVTESPSFQAIATIAATRTSTPLIDIPQSVSLITADAAKDQLMMGIADVVRYVPGIIAIQGENNRDQVVIRGNSSSANCFVNGRRDDVQYYRELYNAERVEALKGPNAMTFGRGGGGGVINRVTKQAGFVELREIDFQIGSFGRKRVAADWDHPFPQPN